MMRLTRQWVTWNSGGKGAQVKREHLELGRERGDGK